MDGLYHLNGDCFDSPCEKPSPSPSHHETKCDPTCDDFVHYAKLKNDDDIANEIKIAHIILQKVSSPFAFFVLQTYSYQTKIIKMYLK